jgi:serine/threonine protein kinase
MSRLSDGTLAHLRRILEWPDVPGDRYEVLELIGQGGMGAVYRARDRALDREVALKVLRPEMASDTLAERLRREARVLARLEHPGVVPIHDAGTLADGRVFYVMKLVRGVRLDEFAAGAELKDVLRVLLRVCETVGFAHAHGVIHRDLKPANIMVGAFGEVLVLDWGIARVAGEADRVDTAVRTEAADRRTGGPADRTAAGTVLGTPGFMAPEQAQGEVSSVNQRTDVYALGAILRAVAGPGKVPRSLTSLWSKACAPDPAQRYASAEELAGEIARFLDGRPVLAHRETIPERLGRLYTRYQTPIILVLTYLAMRLLFLATRGL